MTVLRGYAEDLADIHLTQTLQERALCGVPMYVVYVGTQVPLTHPHVCPKCLTKVVGAESKNS